MVILSVDDLICCNPKTVHFWGRGCHKPCARFEACVAVEKNARFHKGVTKPVTGNIYAGKAKGPVTVSH